MPPDKDTSAILTRLENIEQMLKSLVASQGSCSLSTMEKTAIFADALRSGDKQKIKEAQRRVNGMP